MDAAQFLYKQIQALPEKQKQAFAILWEESKKEIVPTKTKIFRHPVHTVDEAYKAVLEILYARKFKKYGSNS